MPGFYHENKGRERRTVLLVEGKDDGAFFDHLLTMQGANVDLVGISPFDGLAKLQANLEALSKSRPFVSGDLKNVGIVVDADGDPVAAVAHVHNALGSVGLASPGHGQFAGTVPRVGIFILPSGATTGDLEEVCLGTIPNDPKQISASEYFAGADAEFGPYARKSKHRAAIFLALQHGDTRGVGRSFSQGVFDDGHASLVEIKTFLQNLTV